MTKVLNINDQDEPMLRANFAAVPHNSGSAAEMNTTKTAIIYTATAGLWAR